MSKYKISDVIKDINEQLDECILCEGSVLGCDEYDRLIKLRGRLERMKSHGIDFVDDDNNPVKPDYAENKKDDVFDGSADDDGADEEDADLSAAALEDVLDIMDVSDKVLDILDDAEFETHVITTDTYDSVNVSVTTDFGYSTAVGKTYPYNICDNNELLSSVVFDLVRDIVIELEGNYTYMRLMFENCVD